MRGRLLRWLVPRSRRDRYGDEVLAVFDELRAEARREHGWRGELRAWMSELRDVVRMKFSSKAGRAGSAANHSAVTNGRTSTSRGGPGLPTEIRWAWRGVMARRWRAGLIIAVLGVALAANALVFTVADAVVFSPYPYPEPHRMVELRETLPEGTYLTRDHAAQRHREWANQTDLFAAVGGYLQKNVFLTGLGTAEQVRTLDVTVDMLDVIGVAPKWGRPFTDGDEVFGSEFAVLIGESLARRYFDSPQAALGQVLESTAGPHRVVGVMPADFAFPQASYGMWRALDPTGPMTRNFGAIRAYGRIVSGLSDADRDRLLAERAPIVGSALGVASYAVSADPLIPDSALSQRDRLLLALLGAALCLTLAAGASVASLELAGAVSRSWTYAVHLSLGASRWSLARIAALEGAVLVALAGALGVGIAWAGQDVLMTQLPESMVRTSQNRVSLDARAAMFTALVGLVAWALAALPAVAAASRRQLLALLKVEHRTMGASVASSRLRQWLTSGEVAIAVVLIVCGLLYGRSYLDLLAVEKGFDSSRLVSIRFTIPNGYFASRAERESVQEGWIQSLDAASGVEAVTKSGPPPDLGDSPARYALEFLDRDTQSEPVFIGTKWIDHRYFDVVQLPLLQGRLPRHGDAPTDVVVGDSFARKFWPEGSAVGHAFRRRPEDPWYRVVGVVGDFRTAATTMPTPEDDRLFFYSLWQPPPPAVEQISTAAGQQQIDTGGSYGFLSLTARMDAPARAQAVLEAARALDPRLQVTVELVDDIYADQNADTRLASQVVGGFSVVAFLVAVAGIYGLMSYLVVNRRREIGIRLALGADSANIRRLVLGSSLRLVAAGGIAGLGAAVLASRWIESQLFGVSATDPLTYAVVATAVTLTAILATWHPARQAARVDPAVTLRSE